MKRAPLILLAALVILCSAAWAILQGVQNRRAALGGDLNLTERELHLPAVFGDSTALWLELLWRVDDACQDTSAHQPG